MSIVQVCRERGKGAGELRRKGIGISGKEQVPVSLCQVRGNWGRYEVLWGTGCQQDRAPPTGQHGRVSLTPSLRVVLDQWGRHDRSQA